MTGSPYDPQWRDINQVSAEFGLSDETLAQLTQEDASFKRMNSNTVEYDINKIRNHPKVRAFMAKQSNKGATGISYENIIKDKVPTFVLPELTDDQRLYLQIIYEHFHTIDLRKKG